MNAFGIISIAVGSTAAVLAAAGLICKPKTVYWDEPDERNPMEGKRVVFVPDEAEPKNADGVRGHLEEIGIQKIKTCFYEAFVKRLLDMLISFVGLLLLSPVFLAVSLAILIDDPGPVIFSQKRLGMGKRYFRMHKFRSMKLNAPHDIPTHMLSDPKRHMTRVGRFIRAASLDELPQIWDIFIGNMSIVGPRPGLWNQDLLTAERDKYDANDAKPGLTGWAQINGRDELDIPKKAELDGYYTHILKSGGFKAFLFDIKCFAGSVLPVARREGFREGNE